MAKKYNIDVTGPRGAAARFDYVPPTTCSIRGCERNIAAPGAVFCRRHERDVYVYGEPYVLKRRAPNYSTACIAGCGGVSIQPGDLCQACFDEALENPTRDSWKWDDELLTWVAA